MNGVANGLYGGDLPNQINTPWIDYSNQSTIVGWSAFTTRKIRYKVLGKLIVLSFSIVGTSNSATTSFTMPFNIGTLDGADILPTIRVTNNGATLLGNAASTAGSNNLVFSFMSAYGTYTATWTASGTKAIYGQYIFEID
jgi:hypothetical protein